MKRKRIGDTLAFECGLSEEQALGVVRSPDGSSRLFVDLTGGFGCGKQPNLTLAHHMCVRIIEETKLSIAPSHKARVV